MERNLFLLPSSLFIGIFKHFSDGLKLQAHSYNIFLKLFFSAVNLTTIEEVNHYVRSVFLLADM